jgi:hypothetical protein
MEITNVIKLDDPIESTADCKRELNEKVAKKKWKRLYKLGELRCFTNEDGQLVTIAPDGEGDYDAHVGIDARPEIDVIRALSKFYWTTDGYGEIFWNPYTKHLWISGSDGGYGYSVKSLKGIDEEFWDDYDHDKDFKEYNTHPGAEFIKEVHWEAEANPDPEDDPGYMLVGQISLTDE